MTPEITSAIFTLVGVIVGILATSIGTYATLRQQNRIWRNEKQLEELRVQREHIDHLIENMGHMNPWTSEDDLLEQLSTSHSSRVVIYRMLTWSLEDESVKFPPSPENFGQFLRKLHNKRSEIEKQITQLLSS